MQTVPTFCNWLYLLINLILLLIQVNILYIICDKMIQWASHPRGKNAFSFCEAKTRLLVNLDVVTLLN